MTPFKRGDIVEYKWSGGDNKMNGSIGIILGPKDDDDGYRIALISHPVESDISPWYADPFWLTRTILRKVGHLDGI